MINISLINASTNWRTTKSGLDHENRLYDVHVGGADERIINAQTIRKIRFIFFIAIYFLSFRNDPSIIRKNACPSGEVPGELNVGAALAPCSNPYLSTFEYTPARISLAVTK